MKFKRNILIIVFLGMVGNLFSQSNNISSKSTIHIDILGESLCPVSIHYDRIIHEFNSSYLSINTGFGYFPAKNDDNKTITSKEDNKTITSKEDNKPIIGIPLSISWNLGKKSHHLDIGMGVTYSSGLVQHFSREEQYDPFELIIKKSIFGSVRLGYKYQKPNGGFFFKTGLTPVFELFEISGSELDTSYPFFGFSLGYSF